MILSDLALYRYSLPLKAPVLLKGATLSRRQGLLIRLTAQDGSSGWGETGPLPGFSPENLEDITDQLRTVAPSLMNQSLPDPYSSAYNSPFLENLYLYPSVHFGLEVALTNSAIASREAILPDLLKSALQRSVLVSGLLSDTTQWGLTEVRRVKEAGFRSVKLKVGRRGIREDAEAVKRVGQILGAGVSLRLDANRTWSFDEALAFGERVSGVRISYVEEPLAQPGRLPELARVWGLPVALDESLVGMSPEGLKCHAYAGAVVLKPTLLGGVSRVLRFAEHARVLDMKPVLSSSYESGVGTGALVALAAAVGDTPAGLDTYRQFAEDVLEAPLPLPAPEVDVKEIMEAARRVNVGRLENIPVL